MRFWCWWCELFCVASGGKGVYPERQPSKASSTCCYCSYWISLVYSNKSYEGQSKNNFSRSAPSRDWITFPSVTLFSRSVSSSPHRLRHTKKKKKVHIFLLAHGEPSRVAERLFSSFAHTYTHFHRLDWTLLSLLFKVVLKYFILDLNITLLFLFRARPFRSWTHCSSSCFRSFRPLLDNKTI